MKRSTALLALVTLAACGSPRLMPTPVAYRAGAENPFETVPVVFRSNEVDVLFVTDRQREEGEEVAYGYGRSASMAYGSCRVGIGENVSWEELVAESLAEDRTLDLPLLVRDTEEQGRFVETPLILARSEGEWGVLPEDARRDAETAERLRSEIRRRLSLTPHKEAFVYVHGANRAFHHSVSNLAELWHFIGREGVPIAYSWPAGIGGLLGYFYDRESGEFTIYHLKQFLELLDSVEELEKIHIIAHSRGTAVVLTAVRELVLARQGTGFDSARPLKLGNLVLAAPDIDLDVLLQRVVAERMGAAFERVTLYMSLGDLAIGVSTWISHSRKRIGHATKDDFSEALMEASLPLKGLSLIDARVESDLIGHGYFLSHPAVSSDIVLLLRHDADPGAANGRPLHHLGGKFWAVTGDSHPIEGEVFEPEGASR